MSEIEIRRDERERIIAILSNGHPFLSALSNLSVETISQMLRDDLQCKLVYPLPIN